MCGGLRTEGGAKVKCLEQHQGHSMGSNNSVYYLLLNGYLPLWGLTSSLGDHPRIRISGVWPPESGLQSLASIPAKEKLDTRALGELSGSLHTGAVLFITSLLPGMPARSYSTGPVGSTFSIQWTSCVGQLEIIIRPPPPCFSACITWLMGS